MAKRVLCCQQDYYTNAIKTKENAPSALCNVAAYKKRLSAIESIRESDTGARCNPLTNWIPSNPSTHANKEKQTKNSDNDESSLPFHSRLACHLAVDQ